MVEGRGSIGGSGKGSEDSGIVVDGRGEEDSGRVVVGMW